MGLGAPWGGWSALDKVVSSSGWTSWEDRSNGAKGGAVFSGVAINKMFLTLLLFSPREKLEEKAKLYEKMTKGDFIGK